MKKKICEVAALNITFRS